MGSLLGRSDGRVGDKLGPRLVSLWVDASTRSRARLAPLEARIRQAGTQAIVDRAGHELAEYYKPITTRLLAERGDQMHPTMRRHIERAASGAHQWESIAGHLGMAATGALGSVISNVVFPATAELNLHDRNLPLDAQTAAAAAAAGLAPYWQGDQTAGAWGYTAGAFRFMYDLAQAVPDGPTLAQLRNRGLISAGRYRYWLSRAAIPSELNGPLSALRQQLLSPADLALAVLRGTLGRAHGERVAAQSGVSADDFGVILANTGEPLGLEQLLEAYRRGFITEERLKEGVLQSRVRDEWFETARALRYGPVPTADAVDAALRGHISWDKARAIAEANGVEPSQFGVLEANAGSPPAPEQLLELWRRGGIDEKRVDDGLRFGRLRDDWIPAVKRLRDEPLPTADALDAWLRGHITRDRAQAILRENGLLERDWDAAFGNAGNPLALGQLLEGYRRGLIDRDRFGQGFRESRYRDEWEHLALELAYGPMSTADAISAAVQGHLDLAEAAKIAEANGLRAGDVKTLYETAGEPLARTELQQLYNRGLIGLAEVEQGLRESRLKDKYVRAATELHVRLPEPRQVVTALTDGVISREQAHRWLADHGFAPDAITMLIATGEARSTGPHRELAAGEVQSLYSDRIITRERAAALLAKLHYADDTISVILEMADYKTHQRILNSGISAVRAHYLAGRITGVAAKGDLLQLGLPPESRDLYLQVWGLDKLAHPKQLTEAQIVKATNKGLFDVGQGLTGDALGAAQRAEGQRRLVALGYDDTDAQLLLDGA